MFPWSLTGTAGDYNDQSNTQASAECVCSTGGAAKAAEPFVILNFMWEPE